ncbi:MAG: MFS transporter [Acidimicrobiales bacterium]|nr:peptide MFS transporter [Hyphomonadaceae bacterium]RZV42630.1 MAG: MFS transporter [Acidimicrobiales bacterium]
MSEAIVVAPEGEKTILGHPRGLFILFLTEMWERFSYYGMRGLLIIYLTQHFLFSDEKSSVIYGAYTALVYVMTIIGGTLADRYLGARKAVTFGAILLVLGHFGMAFEGNGSKEVMTINGAEYQLTLDGRGSGKDVNQIVVAPDGATSIISFSEDAESIIIENPAAVGLPESINRADNPTKIITEEKYLNILYLSLALIIAGVGYLKANISTIVGSLYGVGDVRRDSGFTIFYMGINLGAFLASIACGYLGITYGWKYGFGLAGIGMFLGLMIFIMFQPWLEGKAEPPNPAKLKEKILGPINVELACYLAGLLIIAVAMFFVMNPDGFGKVLLPLGILMFVLLVTYAFTKLQGKERQKMFAAIYFVLAQIPFWALFEQAGSSLNLFTDRLVDRTIGGWEVPAPVFQSLNAGFIFIFAPIMAWLWIALAKKGRNPSTPVKFAFGVFLAGLGFLALVAGMKTSGGNGMTAVYFIFLIYWIHTMGELMVSPVGLSAVTKMAPPQVVGMTMGAWFLYSGLSNFLAGVIARTTGAETLGGQLTDVAAAKAGYAAVYTNVAYVAIGIAVLMLLMSPIIKKWMHKED